MSDRIRIFVDERPVTVPATATVRDALAESDAGAAEALRAGRAYVTDGVGRPVDPDSGLATGTILRVVRSARATRTHEPRS